MPFTDKRGVVRLPFTLEPYRRRRESFLTQGIDGHDVVSSSLCPCRVVGKRRVGLWLRRQVHGRQTELADH